jgi:hypothetical protein
MEGRGREERGERESICFAPLIFIRIFFVFLMSKSLGLGIAYILLKFRS